MPVSPSSPPPIGHIAPADTWVVIAAYNESTAIGPVLDGLLPTYRKVVVVDDGSADDTAAVAAGSGAHVVVHPFNLGQGAALQTGITYALRQGAEAIVTFDADGQHRVADIPHLLDALTRGADIACGSRFLGTTSNMGMAKRVTLKGAILFTWLTTGLRMTDSHNGLRAFTRRCAQSINIRQNRMAHASELIGMIASQKLKFIEVPVHIEYTEYSKRKGQRLSAAFEIIFDLIGSRVFR